MARRPARFGARTPESTPLHPKARGVIRGATYFLLRSAFPSDAAIAEFAGVDRSRVTRFKQGKNLEPDTSALLDAVGTVVTQLRGFLDDDV
ncbi:MAG: hypothetical protein ACJ8AD_17205, partial [Gemmatimonadaceae bacterium]